MDWWVSDPNERFWCEITDRDDIGTDLNAPQLDDAGKDHWSYRLITEVSPGDIVFHYSTPDKAIVGASVAGGPVEQSPTCWMPHGTTGRARAERKHPRPGWRLPLVRFLSAERPLRLDEIRQDTEWIRTLKATLEALGGSAKLPFQLYPSGLRASQGYFTKMPKAMVQRWSGLAVLARQLSGT